MEEPERDSTQDWLLPETARPPLLSELEARIDEALVTARASEAAALTIGDAALQAAEQAHQAAGIAERAAATALDAQRGVVASPLDAGVPTGGRVGADRHAQGLRGFTERADRISQRLRALA